MRSLLGFIVFATILIAVMVLVVVPLVAGPLISGYLDRSGIVQGLTVDTQGSGPELVTGRADALHLRGTDVAVQGVIIGDVDVTLRGVSIASRTFDSVDGRLLRVRVQIPGGPLVIIASVDVAGPSGAVRATGRLDARQATALIQDAAARNGVRLDTVALGAGSVELSQGGFSATARLAVTNGALVLVPGRSLPTVELLRPAPSSGWTLQSVTVQPDGIDLSGTLDARRLASAPGLLVP